MRRIPHKRDANEPDIIEALERHGWSWLRLRGKGEPDLVCFKGERVALLEVKTEKGKLRPAQVSWHSAWRGPKPVIVRTIHDVEAL